MSGRDLKKFTRKKCKRCSEVKDKEEGFGFNRYKNGRTVVRGYCKTCCLAAKVLDHAKNPVPMMFYAARSRAKRDGIPFTITQKDIAIPSHCPILGIPLAVNTGNGKGFSPNSPSLDKIVPALGYAPGNIIVISMQANRMKSNATLEQLVMMGRWASSALAA
jgi:hypothetical protein